MYSYYTLDIENYKHFVSCVQSIVVDFNPVSWN